MDFTVKLDPTVQHQILYIKVTKLERPNNSVNKHRLLRFVFIIHPHHISPNWSSVAPRSCDKHVTMSLNFLVSQGGNKLNECEVPLLSPCCCVGVE